MVSISAASGISASTSTPSELVDLVQQAGRESDSSSPTTEIKLKRRTAQCVAIYYFLRIFSQSSSFLQHSSNIGMGDILWSDLAPLG